MRILGYRFKVYYCPEEPPDERYILTPHRTEGRVWKTTYGRTLEDAAAWMRREIESGEALYGEDDSGVDRKD